MKGGTKHVGWNGLQLEIPNSWETIISGTCHLLFEDDFSPQLEIRWKTTGPLTEKEIVQHGNKLWSDLSITRPPHTSQSNLPQEKSRFSFVRFYITQDQNIAGGLCFCNTCEKFLIFQLLTDAHMSPDCIEQIISSIVCHTQEHEPITYNLPGFSFQISDLFQLKDYTFKAGLTRLGFQGPSYNLQVCKLARADRRLENQNLKTILTTLAGTTGMYFIEDNTSCSGFRIPTIGRQILYRLKRQTPFIRARILHHTRTNQLFAAVLSSKSAIAEEELLNHCDNYEFIEKI